ncbi:MAG: hypothetical protein R6X16_08695 [Anaerolineae bacterium]
MPENQHEIPGAVIDWLLEGDPAIRWQVQRDLLGEAKAVWSTERALVATEGWGAALLARQDDGGLWAGKLYSPKWTSTTYTLYLLRLLGLPAGHPQALAGCAQLLEDGLYLGREFRFSRGQKQRDLGVTALALAICRYFRAEHPALGATAAFLLTQQRPDGCWLPDERPESAPYAMETTRLVVDALAECVRHTPLSPGNALLEDALARGWEYLLARRLGLGGDQQAKPGWTVFAFPPYWFYDVLTALDLLRGRAGRPDSGAAPAIDLVRRRRGADNRWKPGKPHAGKTFIEMDPPGEPSRWNTLRALRVLRWWEGDVWTSERLDVGTSGRRNVWTSERLDVGTSERQGARGACPARGQRASGRRVPTGRGVGPWPGHGLCGGPKAHLRDHGARGACPAMGRSPTAQR